MKSAKERVNELNPISFKEELEQAMDDHAEEASEHYKGLWQQGIVIITEFERQITELEDRLSSKEGGVTEEEIEKLAKEKHPTHTWMDNKMFNEVKQRQVLFIEGFKQGLSHSNSVVTEISDEGGMEIQMYSSVGQNNWACPKCQSDVKINNKFCNGCGKPFKWNS